MSPKQKQEKIPLPLNCAFLGCASLTSIVIPDGITNIEWSVFENCTSLKNVVIPDGVTEIGMSAFSGCTSLTSIIIPEGVTRIDMNLFWGCASLTSVVIPDGVTEIGMHAFSGCTSLASIVIPESVTDIGMSAFYDCESLMSITIHSNVTSIGDSAFVGCHSLVSVMVDEKNSVYESSGNCLIEKASKMLIYGNINAEIPADGSVTSIGDNAFSCFVEIVGNGYRLTVPKEITRFGRHIFGSPVVPLYITYLGTMEDWEKIDKNPEWYYELSVGMIRIHCMDGDITV